MSGLLPCETEAMQSALETFYDHTLDVYRDPAASNDDYGGYGSTGSATKVLSDVPCEVYPGIAHVVDLVDQGQLVDTQLWTITVANGTDVRKNDLVVITSASDLRLRVNVVFEPESHQLEKRFVADKEILSG